MNFPKIDPTLQEQTPLLGAVTNAIAHSAVKWGSAKNKKSYLGPQDDTMIEMRRLCLERRREKDSVKWKTLSIALHRTRQNMRRTQATLRCKEATQLGASRLKGPPPQTRAPILERVDETVRTEKVDHLQGRTDIVHETLQRTFHRFIKRRNTWPWESLDSLPTIDGERVGEIASPFWKRTSCAEDQVVIEMLRELDRTSRKPSRAVFSSS